MTEKQYAVECYNLSKFFGDTRAVEAVSFKQEKGSLLALLGPSGCGKTTVLRLIAGLEVPDEGDIYLANRLITSPFVPPNNRRVGMVFQDYALFPHLTVEKNVAYGLPRRNDDRVADMLNLVGLRGYEKRHPHELSGGQQQRVALARALAPEPEVLLLDEPFSNLDTALRIQVREEVGRILRAAHVSSILVTHDQEEAMSLADQIALMFDGSIVQIASPRDLYENPVSSRAAQFLGDVNFLEGYASGLTAKTALGEITLRQPCWGPVEIPIRPEEISLDASDAQAVVQRCSYFGTYQMLWVILPDQTILKIRVDARHGWSVGDILAIRVPRAVNAFSLQSP